MSQSTIHTVDPVALRYLMTETIFDTGDGATAPSSDQPATAPGPVAMDVTREQAATSFTFLGGNKRNYLFLTDEQQHEWMPEAAMDAFRKTLAALKLTTEDVAVLNLAKLTATPTTGQLVRFFKPKAVVNLGTSFSWPEEQGVKLCHTCSFGEMLIDSEKKRAFWTTIKTMLT